jgi:putative ABC transport system ATP-binding protein
MLRKVGLAERCAHYPNQLSGGQQQRVAIARALVNAPSVILADEPTGNLDSASSAVVLELFDRLHAEGQTIAMVTHDAQVAARCRSRVEIRDGEIVDRWN